MKKCLAQIAPIATTLTNVFLCQTHTTITSFYVCNRENSNTSFRISLALNGTADETKQYLFYDETIPQKSTIPFDEQTIEMNVGDVLRVYAGNANLSFNFFGEETSI
jgi:hypothetical protein